MRYELNVGHVAGWCVWVAGVVGFVRVRRTADEANWKRNASIAAIIIGVALATWDWFFEVAKHQRSLNRIVGIILNLGIVALGLVFLRATKGKTTPNAKRQRRIAILMMIIGGVTCILTFFS